MNEIDINILLNRANEEKIMINTLENFDKNKKKLHTIRGIYVFGAPGSGKTEFVKKIEGILWRRFQTTGNTQHTTAKSEKP